ncbi:hypothetical protein QN277_027162, partial [Acacia crassicarpa]
MGKTFGYCWGFFCLLIIPFAVADWNIL